MTGTAPPTRARAVATLARRALRAELAMWRSLLHWVTRRPVAAQPDAEPFGYAAPLTPMLGAFIGVSAVEVPILDLILSRTVPWPSVRVGAAVLGAWGLLWMIGTLVGLRRNPHVVSGSGLRVRYGPTVDVTLRWPDIASVRTHRRTPPGNRTVELERTDSAAVLSIGVNGQTTVDVVLRHPMVLPPSAGGPVDELRLHADDAAGLVAAAHRQLAGAAREHAG